MRRGGRKKERRVVLFSSSDRRFPSAFAEEKIEGKKEKKEKKTRPFAINSSSQSLRLPLFQGTTSLFYSLSLSLVLRPCTVACRLRTLEALAVSAWRRRLGGGERGLRARKREDLSD